MAAWTAGAQGATALEKFAGTGWIKVWSRRNRETLGPREAWDRGSGKHRGMRQQNERETAEAVQRDRAERLALIDRQLEERRALQIFFKHTRHRHQRVKAEMQRELACYNSISRELSSLALAEQFEHASHSREDTPTKDHQFCYEHGPR